MAQVPPGATLIDAGDLWFPLVVVENVYIFPGIPELLRKKFESARERFRGVPFVIKRVYVTRMESEIAEHLHELLAEFPELHLGSYPRIQEESFPRAAHARVARRGLRAARARLAARPPAGRRGPPRGVTAPSSPAPRWLAYGHPAWMIAALGCACSRLRSGSRCGARAAARGPPPRGARALHLRVAKPRGRAGDRGRRARPGHGAPAARLGRP
jgi:hypothetical protein